MKKSIKKYTRIEKTLYICGRKAVANKFFDISETTSLNPKEDYIVRCYQGGLTFKNLKL